MRICLAQVDATPGDLHANACRVREAIAHAAGLGADLAVFPELALCGYAPAGVAADTATPAAALPELARPGELAAVVGFHERGADGRSHNSAAWVERGRVVHVHRKLCLVDYPPFDEADRFAPGEELRAFTTSLGRMAILICNDAWQPALPALAAHDGARVLLLVAASSTAVAVAEPTWLELTRCYARLLACYVVFVNRAGEEPGLSFWGGSHVVDPDGRVLAPAPRHAPSLTVADLDLERVDARRRELALPTELRPGLLRRELARLAAAAR